MESLQNLCGISTVSVWNLYSVCLESLCGIQRIPGSPLWGSRSAPAALRALWPRPKKKLKSESAWRLSGNLYCLSVISTVSLQSLSVISTVSVWYLYGLSTESLPSVCESLRNLYRLSVISTVSHRDCLVFHSICLLFLQYLSVNLSVNLSGICLESVWNLCRILTGIVTESVWESVGESRRSQARPFGALARPCGPSGLVARSQKEK